MMSSELDKFLLFEDGEEGDDVSTSVGSLMTAYYPLDTMESPTSMGVEFQPNNINNLTMDESQFNSVVEDFKGNLYTYQEPHNILLICLYIPVFLVAFGGNLLVLWVVLPNRHMRSVTNCFIVNMALADLLVTLVCVPMAIGQSVYRIWVYGEFMCKITNYLQGVSVASSVFTITVLGLDRYLAIKHPLTFRKITAGKHGIKIAIVIWLLSFGIMVPLILARKVDVIDDLIPRETFTFCNESWENNTRRQIYDVFLFLFMFILPGYIVITSYSQIGRQLWTESSELHRGDSEVGKQQAERVMAGRRRIARMLVTVAILFAVCWMPYHLLSLYIDFEESADADDDIALDVLPFTILLGHSNSALNPILYCFMNKTFRKKVLALIHCKRNRTTSRRTIKEVPIKRAVYYSKVNGQVKEHNENQKKPLLRMFSFTSSGSRSSGSLKFSRSSLRSTPSKTTNTNVAQISILKSSRLTKDSNKQSSSKEGTDSPHKPTVKMHHLQKPDHTSHRRSGMNRRRCDQRGCSVNIPTTINEESSRGGSKSPSPCLDERARGRAIIEENLSEEELCSCSMCQYQCSGVNCNCDDCFKGEGVSSCDDSGQDSGGSDVFCETCADAGLVECCHITPEPKIRMALLKTLQTEQRACSEREMRSHQVEKIPVITFKHYQ